MARREPLARVAAANPDAEAGSPQPARDVARPVEPLAMSLLAAPPSIAGAAKGRHPSSQERAVGVLDRFDEDRPVLPLEPRAHGAPVWNPAGAGEIGDQQATGLQCSRRPLEERIEAPLAVGQHLADRHDGGALRELNVECGGMHEVRPRSRAPGQLKHGS